MAHEEGERVLSSHTAEISDQLKDEIQDRLEKAGVRVLEARISHLAYAPENAAVGMVETALEQLANQKIIDLDEERKAAMVSNLLVVLCSDRHTQPVVNTGSIYH